MDIIFRDDFILQKVAKMFKIMEFLSNTNKHFGSEILAIPNELTMKSTF